ncbi:uncharacterized protein LOC116928014 [Daphnia magna]|uniref:uncharacterized protein LOC116928014 n=1 Tax=Daphnia magna TaxID=35525 RepID=UPI001E1BA392|nr:uncharacterized protein LOC116928014 [Daphnia magna]
MFTAFHLEQFSEIRSVGWKVRAVQSTAMESIRTDGSSPPKHVAYKTNVQVETNSIPLQPLLVCLRILGIELVPSSTTEPPGKIDRCKTFTLGVIFLVFNAFCNVYTTLMNSPLFIEDFNTMLNSTTDGTDSTVKISTVLSWNIIIDYVNFGVLAVIVHATLLSLSQQSKWKSLWNNIQRMHHEFKVIRKTMGHLTIVGLAVVSFESIVMISFAGDFIEMKPGAQGFLPALLPAVFRLCAMVFNIYAGCGLLLFALVGWTALLGLRCLQQQVTASSSRTCPSLTLNATSLTALINWKRLHVLLSDVVDGMNECFGPILLIWIIHIFVGFIATPYYIVDGFYRSGSAGRSLLPVSIYLMIQHTFHVLIITGIPNAITQQAIAIGKQLQQIDFPNHLQEQVGMLATEVLISLPRITAMEYGDLELSLIPTMIGTTITYLVILCQFEV